MEEVIAETCVRSLKRAEHDAFNTLKEKAKDNEWLEDFLKAGGLEFCALFSFNKIKNDKISETVIFELLSWIQL